MNRIVQMFLLLGGASYALGQGSILFPGPTEGNSSSTDLMVSSFRFQQVYNASVFGLGQSYLIQGISFRIDGASSADVQYAFGGGSVTLSTTTRGADSLSPVFADNVGSNARTVSSSSFSIGGVYQPGVNPQPWGQTIIFTSPYIYNPGQGNLLIDIAGGGGLTLFPGALDGQSTIGDSVSWVFATSAGSSSGTANTFGLATRLNVSAVPEPSTWLLMTLGLGAVVFLRRRNGSS